MYIPQIQIKNVKQFLSPGKVVVIYGARRTGKTTLLHKFLEEFKDNYPHMRDKILFVNGDDIIVRDYLESQSVQKLKEFVGGNNLLIIDEAQYIHQIGLNLKLIVDNIPDIQIIATGSSSFELAQDIGEPLTGRKYVVKLFPLAQMELSKIEKSHETIAKLENRLIYGSYPEVITLGNKLKQEEYLNELVNAYLFKDILALEGIRHSDKLLRLLQLLAFQIGQEVSLNELGGQLEMSKNTVERYLDLLEKVFVIYHLNGFSRNLRKEISKTKRYFFFDNGIRNSLIRNFNPLKIRDDQGQIWENYIITERIKRQEYKHEFTNFYFWRTYNQQEIDLVEERGGKIYGYEIKWQKKQIKVPTEWQKAYSEASFNVINQENYLDFIL